jgi:hypothetical protein
VSGAAWFWLGVFSYLLAGWGFARLYLALVARKYHLNTPAGRDWVRGNMWVILFLWPIVVPVWAVGKGLRFCLLPGRLR